MNDDIFSYSDVIVINVYAVKKLGIDAAIVLSVLQEHNHIESSYNKKFSIYSWFEYSLDTDIMDEKRQKKAFSILEENRVLEKCLMGPNKSIHYRFVKGGE